jgi:pheromone shutdown protein TraB
MKINEMERVIFVAVIHTDIDSIERARSTVKSVRPEVVAVELDKERYEQLMNHSEDSEIPQPSGNAVEGMLQQIALLEKDLGQVVGSGVGNEMRAAIDEGREIGAKIALVDRPLRETISALMKVPLDEIYKLMGLIPQASEEIEGGNALDFLSQLKEEGSVNSLMEEFETEFPNLFDVLVKQRDEYVAHALVTILNDVQGKIVAVLGAGHIEGVKYALERLLKTESAS